MGEKILDRSHSDLWDEEALEKGKIESGYIPRYGGNFIEYHLGDLSDLKYGRGEDLVEKGEKFIPEIKKLKTDLVEELLMYLPDNATINIDKTKYAKWIEGLEKDTITIIGAINQGGINYLGKFLEELDAELIHFGYTKNDIGFEKEVFWNPKVMDLNESPYYCWIVVPRYSNIHSTKKVRENLKEKIKNLKSEEGKEKIDEWNKEYNGRLDFFENELENLRSYIEKPPKDEKLELLRNI